MTLHKVSVMLTYLCSLAVRSVKFLSFQTGHCYGRGETHSDLTCLTELSCMVPIFT